MRASEKEDVDFGTAERQDFLRFGDRFGRSFQLWRRVRTRQERDGLRKRLDAADVVTVFGSDDHVLDGLRRQRRDVGDQTLHVLDRALALGNQHAVGRDDNQVVHGDDALGGIDLFVGIDVVRELPDPGKVSIPETANRDVRGPNRFLLRNGDEAQESNRQSSHAAILHPGPAKAGHYVRP